MPTLILKSFLGRCFKVLDPLEMLSMVVETSYPVPLRAEVLKYVLRVWYCGEFFSRV